MPHTASGIQPSAKASRKRSTAAQPGHGYVPRHNKLRPHFSGAFSHQSADGVRGRRPWRHIAVAGTVPYHGWRNDLDPPELHELHEQSGVVRQRHRRSPDEPEHCVRRRPRHLQVDQRRVHAYEEVLLDLGYDGVVPAGGPEGPPNYAHADHHAITYHPTNPNDRLLRHGRRDVRHPRISGRRSPDATAGS